MEQAAAAQSAAVRLACRSRLSMQRMTRSTRASSFHAIQSSGSRPNGILVEPVGTGMSQAAGAAVAAGTGGASSTRSGLCVAVAENGQAPVFAVATDHGEVGKIEGAQVAALVKDGGGVLYIEGPSSGGVARTRSSGCFPRSLETSR